MIASRGQRENEDGSRTAIDDPALVAALRPVVRSVWTRVVLATLAAAAALLALPAPGDAPR